MSCSLCGQTGHKRPHCPTQDAERELAELAAMPNVTLLDKLPHGRIVPYINPNAEPLPCWKRVFAGSHQ